MDENHHLANQGQIMNMCIGAQIPALGATH
jgi:hypothetical protein